MVGTFLFVLIWLISFVLLFMQLFTRDALKGHTVSKNGSISFFFFFTRDALKGHTVSKNGSISFFFFFFLRGMPWRGIPCLKTGRFLFFFFFLVATNRYINLFIKLTPLLLGVYCSDCLQQKQANQNPFLSLISRGRGPTHPYLCDVNASFDIFIKDGLSRAILF